MSRGQVAEPQASEVLPALRADDQRRPDLQVLPTLAECEQVIEQARRSFHEVAGALSAIRDGRLYRDTHATFEAYCRERWGIGRNYANKLIAGSALGTAVPNERQARRLRSVTEEPPIDEADARLWDRLIDVMEVVDALSSSDAPTLAATVPFHRRAATAKRLRKLGTFLGRIAWSLESEGTPE